MNTDDQRMNSILEIVERLQSDMASAAMRSAAFGDPKGRRAYRIAEDKVREARRLIEAALVPSAWRFVHPDGKVAVYAEGEVPQNPNPPPPEGWRVEQLYSVRTLAEIIPTPTATPDPNTTNSVGPQ